MPRPVVPILLLPRADLAGDVHRLMVGQDQRAGFRNPQARLGVDAGFLELVEFLDQRVGREHHAVADVTGNAVAQDARWHQVQHRLLAADDQVWPALCPPWKRTTPCEWSVSQSTILPLPSSPHWVPTTTTFFAISVFLKGFNNPVVTAAHQMPVAAGFAPGALVSRQGQHHPLALRTQALGFGVQGVVFGPRSGYRAREPPSGDSRTSSRRSMEKPGCGTPTAVGPAKFIVAATQCHRRRTAGQ
jgi:hypothetical protein